MMLNNAPSAFQFLSSLALLAVVIFALRAMTLWFVKANDVLDHLRAISAAVGIPIAESKHSLLVRLFKGRRKGAPVRSEAANNAAGVCQCCGAAVGTKSSGDGYSL